MYIHYLTKVSTSGEVNCGEGETACRMSRRKTGMQRGVDHSIPCESNAICFFFLTSCSLGLPCFNNGRVNHPLAVSKCETLASPSHCTACFSNILAEQKCSHVGSIFLSKINNVKLFLTTFFPMYVQAEGEDSLKKMQLMELAILNGTYRDANVKSRKNDIIKHRLVYLSRFPSPQISIRFFSKFYFFTVQLYVYSACKILEHNIDIPQTFCYKPIFSAIN